MTIFLIGLQTAAVIGYVAYGLMPIPAAYWKPQPPKLDKITLLAAVKNGVAILGVALSPPRVQLSVRSK